MKRETKRVHREQTSEEANRLERERVSIAEELPELIARDQLRKEAREEQTLSGELRRAIHESEWSVTAIAKHVKLSPRTLDEFLTGEGTLPSDAIDRLVGALGYALSRSS